MKRFVLTLCFLAVISSLTAQDFPPDTQIGDYQFFMPRGWNRVDKPAGTLIVAPITAPQMAYIALLPAVDLQSGLRAAFDEQWNGFKQQYRILQGGQIASQHAANDGYDAVVTSALAADQKGTRWVLRDGDGDVHEQRF